MQKFQLDFNIYSAEDRMDAIKKIPLDNLTKAELETITNYVLYGKDQDGTSCVDRKEVQIKTKYNSYNKDKVVSLDALMESPSFDEKILKKDKTVYRRAKPILDKDKIKDIPGMQELWDQIQKLQKILDQNIGKKPREESTPVLTQKQIYTLKHQLIELKTQQYYLADSIQHTINKNPNREEYYNNPIDSQLNYLVLPRGVMRDQKDIKFKTPRLDRANKSKAITDEQLKQIIDSGGFYFDFRNYEHIYNLIQHYEEIKDQIRETPDSPLYGLLWTLDFYIEKADFNQQQKLIIRDKKFKMSNKDIADHLMEELGIYHQENYISTIWTKIIKSIVAAVELNYDEWLMKDYDKAWKVCAVCGKELLRDPRNFVKKAKAIDGLTNKCKKCDKRQRKKN